MDSRIRTADTETVRSKSASNALISIGSRGFSIFMTLGTQALFGRWLSPSDYGLYALAVTILVLLLVLREFGLQAAGLQKADLSQEDASFIFWANLVVLFLVLIAGVLGAPLMSLLYGQPALTAILQVVVVVAVIAGASGQHAMLLRRRMQFAKIAISDISSLAIATAVGLTFGYYHRTVWAIVIIFVLQQLLNSIFIVLFCGWAPNSLRSTKYNADIVKFGFGVTFANLVYFLTNNISILIIGYLMSPSMVGNFNRSQQISNLVPSILSTSAYAVIFGSLSRLKEHQSEYKDFYINALMFISSMIFGLAGFLTMSGDNVVRVLLGPGWDSAGHLLRVMAIGLIGVGASQMTGLLFQSQARLREFQAWSIVDGCLRITSIMIGVKYGAIGVACAFSLMTSFISAPASIFLAGRAGPVSAANQFSLLAKTLPFVVYSGLGAYLPGKLFEFDRPFILLTVNILCSVICMLGFGLVVPTTREIVVRAYRSVFNTPNLQRYIS